MTRVTGVGTVVARAGHDLVLLTFSGAIVATATQTGGNADVVITAIGLMIGIGVAAANARGNPFLTPFGRIRIMAYPALADVAELADAQVSEACDGDIVEVQVLSSAPKESKEI